MKLLLSSFIGWRYTRAKRRNSFVSFIAFASMIGIALGMTVLITVLSVMNGFDQQIRLKFFALAPQLSVYTGLSQPLSSLDDAKQTIVSAKGVVAASPYVSGNGMLVSHGLLNGLQLLGIDPAQETQTSKIADNTHLQ